MINAETDYTPASLWRRLGAILYDSILAVAVLLFAIGLVLVFMKLVVGTKESCITLAGVSYKHKCIELQLPAYLLYLGGLYAVVCLFFAWFWSHGGQTLGMRTWRIRLERDNGASVSFLHSILRLTLGIATAGIGLLWIFIDKQGKSAYDRLLKSRVIVTSKNESPQETP